VKRAVVVWVLAAGLVWAVSAFALAPPPPTWAELLMAGGKGTTVASAPGLVRPIPPTPIARNVPVPPARACAALWNSDLPRATRRWLARSGSHKANVTVWTSGGQVIGSGKGFVHSQCAYGIAVGPRQLVIAAAPTQGVQEPWGGEVLTYTRASTLKPLVARFNAVVLSDGAIRLLR